MGRKRTVAVRPPEDGPTLERLRQSRGDFVVGDDQQGGKVITMIDNPLAKARQRETITERQYRALSKFKHHWHAAGLEVGYGSADLNRVFGSDPCNFSGMAKTEHQVFHRQRYREACKAMGMVASRVIEAVVCEERDLADVGRKLLNWGHALQARAVVTEKLRDEGDRLAKLWGIDG
jgi:hypothetical protein